MIVVHGRLTSSNVQPVLWLINELGLDYERRDVGGVFGGANTPEFLKMNPMGRIPVIQDGALTLFESQAILRYLAAEYGQGAVWADSASERARIDQWMEWAKTSVAPNVVYRIFWQLVRTPSAVRKLDDLHQGIEETKKVMLIANHRLSEHKWLAGEHISLADFSFAASLFRYFTLDFDKADTPHLNAYYERLTLREAYRNNVMIPYDSLRVEGA